MITMVNFNKFLGSLKGASESLRKPLAVYSIINLAIIYLVFAKLNTIAVAITQNFQFLFMGLFCIFNIFAILAGSFYKFPLSGRKRTAFDLLGLIFAVILIIPMDELLKVGLLCAVGPLSLGLYVSRILTQIISITNFENRGGIAGLFTFLVYALVILVSPISTGVFELGILVFALKMFTLLLKDEKSLQSHEGEYNPTPTRTKVYFIFIWIIFIFVDYFSVIFFAYLVPRSELILLNSVTIIMGLFSMIVGGIIFDYFGRKRPLLFSYAYLGLVYAFISLSGGELIRISFVEGIAWGLLTPLFIIILWGDVCNPKERPIYVGVSIILLFANNLFGLIEPSIYISAPEFFPLVSTLLFLATFVILFLPETLPEKILQKRDLERYLQKVKEIKEKYQ